MALASVVVSFIMSPTRGGDGMVLMAGVAGFIMVIGVALYALRSFAKNYPSPKGKPEPDSSATYSKEQIFNARARAIATIAFLFLVSLFLFFR